jgi:hypothetical protein
MLTGTSDAATHGWQNYWGPCVNDAQASVSVPPGNATRVANIGLVSAF